MSVFTVVDFDDVAEWVAACGAGTLQEFTGVEGGVENTNYRIVTERGAFVLTLFEWMDETAAARSLALTAALADAGLPVARPWRQMDGWLAPLEGKPAALSAWLDGTHPEQPNEAQCAEIGAFLARMHLAIGNDCGGPDPRDASWRVRTLDRLMPGLDDEVRATVAKAESLDLEGANLPRGTIHADLFRDNALFLGDALCGVVDFHYACLGNYMDDVAVAALDWCWTGVEPDSARLAALCGAYADTRTPRGAERAHFAAALIRAALRFWLSRQHDLQFPRPGTSVMVKDPAPMFHRMRQMLDQPVQWPG